MKSKSKKRKPSKAIVRTRTKIVHVRTEAPKPWLVSAEETAILKNSVCRGATDAELKFCLLVASRYRLDPFKQQIWFVPRWDSKAQNSEGKEGAKVYVPQVSINGLLHIAARDHKDFGSYSEPVFGPDIAVTWTNKYKNNKVETFKAPEWARVSTTKKGDADPTTATVYWEEIYFNVDDSPMVRRMPKLMLAKCARAQVTRIAYPETGGLYIPEESQGREYKAITPGGRLISEATPAGQNPKQLAQDVGAQVIEKKKAAIVAHNATKTIDVTPKEPEAKAHPPAPPAGNPTPAAKPAATTPQAEPVQQRPQTQTRQATARPASVPSAVIPPKSWGKLVGFEVKENSNKSHRGEIHIEGEAQTIYAFHNSEMQIPGAPPQRVFDLFAAAIGADVSMKVEKRIVPAKNNVDDAKVCWEVPKNGVHRIGPYGWEDGLPVIQREAATYKRQSAVEPQEDLFPGEPEDEPGSNG